MPKHIIANTHILKTTWFHEVEADTPEAALAQFKARNHPPPTHIHQELDDGYSTARVVDQVPANAYVAPARRGTT